MASDDSFWLWLIPAWAAYFLLHSLLAALAMKRRVQSWWPAAGRYYRLLYNLLAVLLLLPIAFLLWLFPGPELWRWQGWGWWLVNALAGLAVLGFWWSLRWYDSSEFLGTAQLRQVAAADDGGRLRISPLHRFVRHPWYSFGLVLVWTRDMSAAMLVTALAITVYFILGSRLEERKLMQFHGAAYRRYCEKVPGLLPRPWRYLSAEEAARIESADENPRDPAQR